jgi:hypothetical protein
MVPTRLESTVMRRGLAVGLLGFVGGAATPGGAVVAGGGPAESDCAVVWDGVTATKGRRLSPAGTGPDLRRGRHHQRSCTIGANVTCSPAASRVRDRVVSCCHLRCSRRATVHAAHAAADAGERAAW